MDSASNLNSIKKIMIQGTASHVGKSLITAALCRIFFRLGKKVAPFKAQNMALNSFVTSEGLEIGRAQAFQAEAAGIEAVVDINPILLKPTGDAVSQVIVRGEVYAQMTATEYHAFKPEAFVSVLESFAVLAENYELIIIEGAGSPAEINLRQGDIVNMGLAEEIDCPVVLVGDIDRGGVFASIVGTMELLSPSERARVKGVIINKFRGDKNLLDPGLKFLEERLGIPVLGVIPHLGDTSLPDEDGVSLDDTKAHRGKVEGKVNIAVFRFPRISNFTDFDPLKDIDDVEVRYIHGTDDIEAMLSADLIILPGSKNIISDLGWLRDIGFTDLIGGYLLRGGLLFGICGGFQMLGSRISDPYGVEGSAKSVSGLGLLAVETVLQKEKNTFSVEAKSAAAGGEIICGYEIHMGESTSNEAPFALITSRSSSPVSISDGAISEDGAIFGTYIHGVFDNDLWRNALLNRLRRVRGVEPKSADSFKVSKEAAINAFASKVEESLDMEKIIRIIGL